MNGLTTFLSRADRQTRRVMIKCPASGTFIYTGVAMDAAAFDTVTLLSYDVRCPECGAVHSWCKSDASLEMCSS